ncbi:MAG: sigma-54-dependent Fis family transcriptional regulator [bacterium]|nr:sigma-54-dependent Fis family transcriptional regulator [bacterium]
MTSKRNILIVDDEHSMRDFLESSLTSRFTVFSASNGRDGFKILKKEKIDLVLSDVQMPGGDGLEMLGNINSSLDYKPTVVMMTAFGTIEGAVEATRRGATDYLTKPFGLDQLNHVLNKCQEHEKLVKENQSLRKNITSQKQKNGLLGNNHHMESLRETIAMVADSRGTVLLQGESGTGKEVVAQAIHYSGPRANGPFIRLNCAAIPESLLESELFGYERGAFTGAINPTKGKFELADGGTLLLDEISEMPFAMQAKLLRVLQEKEFMRLGSKYATKADVRIIATTNRNLKEEIKARNFREDLYFRLNVIPIRVVPLRQRKDDIPLLANHFCQVFCAENDKPLMKIESQTMARLSAMDWPGNVRQLQNVIERAVILSQGDELNEDIFGLSDEMEVNRENTNLDSDLTLREMEKQLILRKLTNTSGNRTLAAQELGISVRTLRNKLNIYTDQGVEIPG